MSSYANQKKKRNDFGATSPPFIDYLKDILRRYPDGGQILKELIQNADDGGASEVVFIYDETTYGTQNLWTEDLGKYQGAALYAYNNAEFTEDDWRGIQATGRSVKRNDPNKVGRFGIGFNSVYHITDLPCIFSGKHLGMLDPQEKIFGERKGGFQWSLEDDEDRETLLSRQDQFQPFRDILQKVSGKTWKDVVGKDRIFSGTVFRFPLRNDPSDISDNLYDSERMLELFDSFIADADISLLFLRNVSSVSLKHISSNGSVIDRLKLSASRPIVNVAFNARDKVTAEGSTCFKNISSYCPNQGKTNAQWLVTTCCMKEGQIPDLDSLAKKLSFRPQVDLAFPIDKKASVSSGRLSCFLPLPNNETNRTGLPVHVNACFGLTDNRRHIKWQEEDQKHDEAAVWNELLVKDVLPHAYHIIMLDAIHLSRNASFLSSLVYRLWPDIDQMKHNERWQRVAVNTLQNFLHLNEAILCQAGDAKKWVKLSEAVFLPDETMDPQMKNAVTDVLIAQGENLVSIASHVSRDIQLIVQSPTGLKSATPAFVRAVLRRSATVNLSREGKFFLLEYVLSDGKYHELWGLQLLPLSDGTFKSFTNEDKNLALIDSEQFPRELLPMWQHRFLPRDLQRNAVYHLRQLAATNTYNKIINMDAASVAALAIKNLPMDWQTTQGHVTWKVGNSQHPPMQWLKEFWKFLNIHWRELSKFDGMPLIPVKPLQDSVSSVTLARIQKKTTLVFQETKQNNLPTEIAKVVEKVGGTIIKRDTFLKHQDLENFVLTPSPRNILQLFLNIEKRQVICGIESASAMEKEALKSYFSSLSSLTNVEKCLLSELPLFHPMVSLKGYSGEYAAVKSKQAVVLNSIPSIPTDLVMADEVVQCANEADRRLLTLLNIDLLSSAKAGILLVDGIEKRLYKSEETDKIMMWILEHGNVLFSQDQTLYKKCKDLSFINVQGREYKKASSFFDPDNKIFKVLFETDFFPPPAFTRTKYMLQSLKSLGLQTEEQNISSGDVLHVAKHIEKLHVHSSEKTFVKADVLTGLLNNTNVLSKFSAQQLWDLVHTQWVPCKNPDTVNGNHEVKSQEKSLFKPAEIRHSKYCELVGHVMPLTNQLNERVSEKLGLLSLPPAEKVFKNLSALRATLPEVCEPDTEVDFKRKLHSTYACMQDNIAHFRDTAEKKTVPWLWIHSHFVFPHDVVLAYPHGLDLSSHIEKVPEEFLVYKRMLTEFGVKASVSEKEVEEILYNMKQKIDERCPSHGTRLELTVAIAILNWMCKEKKQTKDDLPVPAMAGDKEFNLQPLSSTVFCDITREGLEDLREDQEVFHVVHEDITQGIAKWLKIPSLSTRILRPEFVGIEQCGQTEPITLRIKNILKEYNEEKDLFKELIQNAEDAGASTCRFMLDFRKHKDSPDTLIDADMSLCHGPCLWAFNNELFKEEDWINIVKVGSASKENKVEKIGKFGLGFNAVYHVTDIPSVLSGKKLLILDPNVTHLKKHIQSKANPGIKLDLFQERLFRRFPGQFKPYQGIFDCDLSMENVQKFYQGTLIKLPFRTQEEATNSEISKKVYDEEDIIAFQQHLTNNAEILLLFLRKVDKLSLEILSESASTPPQDKEVKSLLTVTRKVVSTVRVPDDIPLKTMKNDGVKVLFDSNWENVIGCQEASIIEMTKTYKDEAGIKYWLVHSCIGMKKSFDMLQRKNTQMNSLPIGSTAVPLQKNTEGGNWLPEKSSMPGQVFCFLPLPINSGLPVHVNGSFSVTSNRKGLWETGEKHEWNKALLQDAVTTSYISALSVLKKMSEKGELQGYPYYTFWPDKEKVSTAFESLIVAFYSAIAHNFLGKSLELFSDGTNWCSIDKARFLHPDIEQNKKVGQLAMKEFLANHEKHYLAVPLPEWVRNSFKQTGFNDIIEERTFDWITFYQEVVFQNLSAMDPESRNSLVLHAIDMNDKAIDSLLKRYACIPAEGCEQLQFIRKLVNPSGKVACLYEPEECRFLKGTAGDFCSPKRIQRLTELGMLSDHLSLADIKERVRTIARIWQRNKSEACKRIRCILDLTSKSLHDESSPHWESIRSTAFIPAWPPQISDQGKRTSVTLKKPTDLYSHRCQYLVNMTQFTVDQATLQPPYYDSVLSKLGVLENPPINTVLQQLEEAQQHCSAFEEGMLSKIAYECYGFLDKLTNEQTTSVAELIFKRAQSFPFVLIEDKFVNVRSVAKKMEFEAKPYLYGLPSGLSKFKNLWKCVGIQKHFTSEQFVGVLQEFSNKYRNEKLCHSDLNICLTVITKGLYKPEDEKPKDCVLPDESGVLHPSHQLHFNDSPWMPVSPDVVLCHALIPRIIALHFGVKTTRHRALQNHLIEGFSPFVKEFGQHEELTVRLKNIIAAYPSKKDILKELIQNADDAEATEIHFVWDTRTHNTEKTFGEKWNPLQGPSLCVYNNKLFSDTDLKGIQQLGEGGKHGTPGKTGKYGLGFNSVYHLTDCPAFVTGDRWLCISDPNLNYVEAGTKQSPGCMYSLEKEFKDSFPDLYNTFLPEDFSLKVGTMLRLPLRTEGMAKISEISKDIVTPQDIEELSSELSKDPEGLILFLRYIQKIQFHEICPHTNKLRTTFSTEIKLSEKNFKKKDGFQNHVQKSLRSRGPAEPVQAIYEMDISSSPKKLTQWIIAEQFGALSENPDMMTDRSDTRVPQAAVAACLNSKLTGRMFCSLPLPGHTGLPVHVNGNFEVDSSRRDLWKEDGKSLKMEWNESLKLNVIAPLYADLLNYVHDTVKKDSHSSLLSLGQHLDSAYLHFFPKISDSIGPEWHGTINAMFKSINERNLHLIPVFHSSIHQISYFKRTQYTISWSSVTNKEPTDAPHFTSEYNDSLHQTLEDVGMNLVPFSCSMDIFTSFMHAGVEVRTVSPLTVGNYLRRKLLNDPTKTENSLPLPVSQTLIKSKGRCKQLLDYCLKKTNENESILVSGLPLLLTCDQILRVFNADSPRLFSKFCELFQGHADDFADYRVNCEHIEVLEDGHFLKKMTIRDSERYLKPILEGFLQNCDRNSMLPSPEEAFITWLKQLWKFFCDQVKSATKKDRENNKAFVDIKDLFSDSPIVPVICQNQGGKCFLKTPGTLCSVISFSEAEVPKILLKLGFMTLNTTFFRDFRELSPHLTHELLDATDSRAVLDQLYVSQHCQFDKLSDYEMDALLWALQSVICSAQNTQKQQSKLKSLPLFETIQGNRQRVDKVKKVFILKTDLMQSFPDLYTIDKETIFLRHSAVNETLAKKMDIVILDDLEYYVKFILPALHRLNNDQVLNSVRMLFEIQHNARYQQYNDKIVNTLKNVRFVRDVHGVLQVASYYYDENVYLYQIMLPKERFVPAQFWDIIEHGNGRPNKTDAKQLLKELGLKHTVLEEELIQFAHQVASDAKGNISLKELKQKSDALFGTVLNRDTPEFLNTISSIKFIFPLQVAQNLCEYHQPFAAQRQLVAIKGSLIQRDPQHQFLIWTSLPILPSESCTMSQINVMKEAGALEKPNPQHVTENLMNICQAPCENEEMIQTRREVFRHSYGFLQSMDFDACPLMDLPLVLVENNAKLVTPKQTVLTLDDHVKFRPYLFKVPSELAIYEDFFKKIGVEETPSTKQYISVLQAIYQDTIDKQRLNPNQLKTCKHTVKQLFNLIEKTSRQKPAEVPEPLYLPARDGRLYESTSLYFNDTSFQVTRCEDSVQNKLKLLDKLNNYYLDRDCYKQQKLIQLLPHNVRPKLLSEVITEKLVESSLQWCEYREYCHFRSQFEGTLSSSHFLYGLVCLVRQQCSGTVSQNEAENMCQNSFRRIKIICCENLETVLFLNQQPLDNTTAETQVYVKREQERCTFYLKHSDDQTPKVMYEVLPSLANEINVLLKNALETDSLFVLQKLLVCESMEDVQKMLERNGIRNSAEDGHCHFPDPGSIIPDEWIDTLDMNFLNNFEKGEYVGFRKPTCNEYCFAIVVEEVNESLNQGRLSSRKYKIKIGIDEVTEVSVLDLYQFKRVQRPSSSAGNYCKEIVPSQAAAQSAPPPAKLQPQSLEEIKAEIDKCLTEIWMLPKEERRKGIRRLYLRWHPDKNPDCVDLATEACKYLQQRVEELKMGKPSRHGSGASERSSPRSSGFSDFFKQWDQEASRHRRGRENFHQRHSSRNYDFWEFHGGNAHHGGTRPTSNPEEAKRWYRQAKCDLTAAHNDTGGKSPEWCLFKVHQAVEKALIGAKYKSTGKHSTDCSISSLAWQLSHCRPKMSTLPDMVNRLKQLGVDAKKTQYPNYHTPPGIPNTQFNSQDETQVLNVASQLLTTIDAYISE
ncbi:sacsin-like [Megalops cyprinoides]|uniref:sacsin-like n=1 Tax=Megalops cyprinoides TaxID=118141 RepID=UPI001864F824|nr:sacsin-like [Megalops cyprinoides]